MRVVPLDPAVEALRAAGAQVHVIYPDEDTLAALVETGGPMNPASGRSAAIADACKVNALQTSALHHFGDRVACCLIRRERQNVKRRCFNSWIVSYPKAGLKRRRVPLAPADA